MEVNSNFGSWCITFHKRVDYGHSMLCVGNLRENIVCNNVFNPKRAGLFGPISQPGGGADSAPPQDLGNRLTKHQVCGTSG